VFAGYDGPSVRVIRGHDVVFQQKDADVNSLPMTAGNSMEVHLQSEYADFVAIRSDPTGQWRTTQGRGQPLWMDDTHLLMASRDQEVVDIDLEAGTTTTLGRLDTQVMATDGRYLFAAAPSGAVTIYRISSLPSPAP
jgi:hypothetical protein